MTDVGTYVTRALGTLMKKTPFNLLKRTRTQATEDDVQVSEEQLLEEILNSDINYGPRKDFQRALALWDEDDSLDLEGSPHSQERRLAVLLQLGLLGFSETINENVQLLDSVIVISGLQDWEPWYTKAKGEGFYWDAYEQVLERKIPDLTARRNLSHSVDEILSRLANPAGEAAYQSKGLVVGHVQSGKTANYTGLIAKAVDSGYRLIIVLTGTVEILRSQTQKRLDMELVGKQNILGGRDPKDPSMMVDLDYVENDADWKDGFVTHIRSPVNEPGVPEIKRLTTLNLDYKSLKQGLDVLDPALEKADKNKPLFDPINLRSSNARLVVLKKNSTVLNKFRKDLKSIHANLAEIPTLIIDDEADQASVNTRKPNPNAEKNRTAINKHLSELLTTMPRAQYVGYTATPFANVFVNPEDEGDIFPRDFLISLPPGEGYMGGKDFHDLFPSDALDTEDPGTSNEAAFVRDLRGVSPDDEDSELADAIDAYLLTGAIKLFRASRESSISFRHHTMLVHTSHLQDAHSKLKAKIQTLWEAARYRHPDASLRLWGLFERDFLRVSDSRNWGHAMPASLQELEPFIAEALVLIEDRDGPVVVVNGATDKDYEYLAFDKRQEWKIITGGAKLSRGFTVEGLTISYFLRRTMASDSLMQMGRWFGYRANYADLVRLFIGRTVKNNQGKEFDLYEAFTSSAEDEEEFRQSLADYSGLDETGRPMMRPVDFPPLVFSQLPWLKPTSRNKMFNAVLTQAGIGGRYKDYSNLPPRGLNTNRKNFGVFRKYLEPYLTESDFFIKGSGSQMTARHGIVPAGVFCDYLSEIIYSGKGLGPTEAFIRDAIAKGTIVDFFIMLHLPPQVPYKRIGENSDQLPVIRRRRRGSLDGGDRLGFVGQDPDHKAPLEVITEVKSAGDDGIASRLTTETRAAFLISITRDCEPHEFDRDVIDPGHVAVLLSGIFPSKCTPRGRVAYTYRDVGVRDSPTVEFSPDQSQKLDTEVQEKAKS